MSLWLLLSIVAVCFLGDRLRRLQRQEPVVQQEKKQEPRFDLFSSWSDKGTWWIPSDPNHVVAGEFAYEGLEETDGLKLVLTGLLHHRDAIEELLFNKPSDEAALWIYGKTNLGFISLADAVRANAGTYDTLFHPRLAILGDEFVTADTKYTAATVTLPGLNAFVETSPKGQLLEQPPTVTVSAAAGDIQVNLRFHRTQVHEREVIAVEIWPKLAQSIDKFIEIVYSLQYFFSVLFGFPVCPKDFVIHTTGGSNLTLWYQFGRKNILQEPTAADLAYIYSRLTPQQFEYAITTWLGLSDLFLDYTYNFLGNYYHPHPKARVNLVFHAQSLERFHALTVKGAEPPKEQLDAVAAVNKFVRENLPQDLHAEFAKTLGFLKTPSQRMRLEELFQQIDGYLPILDDKVEIPNFVNCVVKTRNYHIHGGEKPKCMLSTWEETIAVEGLKLANLFLIWRYLNLPAEPANLWAVNGFLIWETYYRSTLYREDLLRKLSNTSTDPKYQIISKELSPCSFCGSTIMRQSLQRSGKIIRTRTFCPNELSHPESNYKCLACGKNLHMQGSSGPGGESYVTWCSNENCPLKRT